MQPVFTFLLFQLISITLYLFPYCAVEELRWLLRCGASRVNVT